MTSARPLSSSPRHVLVWLVALVTLAHLALGSGTMRQALFEEAEPGSAASAYEKTKPAGVSAEATVFKVQRRERTQAAPPSLPIKGARHSRGIELVCAERLRGPPGSRAPPWRV